MAAISYTKQSHNPECPYLIVTRYVPSQMLPVGFLFLSVCPVSSSQKELPDWGNAMQTSFSWNPYDYGKYFFHNTTASRRSETPHYRGFTIKLI